MAIGEEMQYGHTMYHCATDDPNRQTPSEYMVEWGGVGLGGDRWNHCSNVEMCK